MPFKPLTHAQRQRNRKDTDRAYDEARRGNVANTKRQTTQWRKLSKSWRRRHPLCDDPYGTHKRMGETVPADHVHHKIPIVIRPDLVYTESNLQSVCACCHAKLEKAAKG